MAPSPASTPVAVRVRVSPRVMVASAALSPVIEGLWYWAVTAVATVLLV